VVKAVAEIKGAACDLAVTVSADARQIADSLAGGQNAAVLLGNFAQQHPQASLLNALAQQLAGLLGGRFGFLGEAANSVGGYLAKAVPVSGGADAARMLSEPRRAYLVLGAEPELDCADGVAARAAFAKAASVVVLSPFKSAAALEYADAILPIAPFTESSGTFVSAEGRVQSFQAATKPLGETRPGWKVLRVLGNLLELDGFAHDSSEDVREECLTGKPEFASGLDNAIADVAVAFAASGGIERVADVPIHFADALVRRAPSLQRTADAAPPAARMNAATLAKAGLAAGANVTVRTAAGVATLKAVPDAGVADDCVRIAAAHAATANLGAMFGAITLEKV
jgi:NADH-quinone oxidoreductase subunit G